MAYKLVFIDDHMPNKQNEPFVRAIGKFQSDAEISVFVNPQEGLDFVLNNLNNQMIVFLDCRFDGYGLQGMNVLKKIREQTSLLYVVMMSANAIKQIDGLDIIEMINEDFISFYDRNNGSIEMVCNLIEKIKSIWKSRFDCVLEEWLTRHPEDNYKEAYSELSTGKTYTWAEILIELRHQTPVGKSFEQMIHDYYIYQLTRSKK